MDGKVRDELCGIRRSHSVGYLHAAGQRLPRLICIHPPLFTLRKTNTKHISLHAQTVLRCLTFTLVFDGSVAFPLDFLTARSDRLSSLKKKKKKRHGLCTIYIFVAAYVFLQNVILHMFELYRMEAWQKVINGDERTVNTDIERIVGRIQYVLHDGVGILQSSLQRAPLLQPCQID